MYAWLTAKHYFTTISYVFLDQYYLVHGLSVISAIRIKITILQNVEIYNYP